MQWTPKKPKEKLSRLQQRAVSDALQIAQEDWKIRYGAIKTVDRWRKQTAENYRAIAATVKEAGRLDLAQTVLFIASEIELGVGLGPYNSIEG